MNVRSRQKKGPSSTHWLLLLKLGIVALVTVFIIRAVQEGRADFARSDFSVRNIHVGWLLIAGCAYSAGMLPMAMNWHRLLRAMGRATPLAATIRTHYVSQLGKYVPGKAMVVLIRLGLLRSFQVDAATGVLSIFAETLAMMSIGAVLASALLAIQFREHPQLAVLALGMALAAGLPISPPVLRLILGWMRRRRFGESNDDHATDTLTWSVLLPGWLGILLGWCLLGFSMWAVLKALNLPSTQNLTAADLPQITATYAISVVAGFMSMLPAGVGVREWVIKELIEPSFGTVVALLAPVLHRLMSLVSELVVSGILYWVGRKW